MKWRDVQDWTLGEDMNCEKGVVGSGELIDWLLL
jgi:hypothetical protein